MERPLGSRYRVGEQLGRGGMGTVYRGVDDTGRAVAIKVLRPELATDPEVLTRFVRERTALIGVRDRHLVAVHDLVVEGDTLGIVMDLVQGPDLRAELRTRGVFDPADAARVGAGIAAALAAAHAGGVLHRDVKPENVLLDISTDPPTVRLADFGIARLTRGAQLTRQTALIGTPSYLAPEVCAGFPPGPAVDLYALGVVLYELCCGVPPFGGDLVAVVGAHVAVRPGRPAGVPEPLWALIASLLAKDPAQRPDGAAPVAATLAGLSTELADQPPAPRLDRPPPGTPVVTMPALADPGRPVGSSPGATRVAVTDSDARPPAARRRRHAFVVLSLLVATGLASAATWAAVSQPWERGCADGEVGSGCGTVAEVERVQRRLLELCYYLDNSPRNVNVDGTYGSATDSAVRRFEVAHRLPVDGVVDEPTAATLFGSTARANPGVAPCSG